MSEPSAPRKYRRLKELLADLLELSPDAQSRYLDGHCASDPSMRRALETLLGAAVDASGFLEPPSPAELRTEPYVQPAQRDQSVQVRGYRIEGEIKSGGMGTVYRARREDPEQEVALKVIKKGMDTREVLLRFAGERRALALMNHSNIAKIFDAGETSGGNPFFVMEYVPGQPITRYCDERGLSIEDRLRLFRSVCEAVQHAHQRTVIHRDLKPSNILVASEGRRSVPKIIDFGLAKALTPMLIGGTRPTAESLWVGTPEYMSPEQAASPSDVDTRTDVYSLGVVLYELLTGCLPISSEELRRAGLLGIPSQIEKAVVVRPSRKIQGLDRAGALSRIATDRGEDAKTLRRKLRRDLDWVTMKCLEKDPSRRYRNVDDLVRDIDNFLSGRPVDAAPPEFGYRLSKFVSRNRRPLAATLALVALVGFGAYQAVTSLQAASDLESKQVELDKREAAELVDEARLLVFMDSGSALSRLELAASKAPDSVAPPLEIARLHQISGQFARAQESADRLVKSFPNSGAVQAFWAAVFRDENPERSAAALDRARSLFQVDGVSLRRANSRLAFEMAFGDADADRAIEALNESIELNEWYFPSLWQRARRYFQRGQQRFDSGDLEGAAEDFRLSLLDSRKMTRVRDEMPMCWIQQGAVQLELGRIVREQARSQSAEDRIVTLGQAKAEVDAAIAALTRAIDLRRTPWQAFYDRALAFEQRARIDSELADASSRREDLEQGLPDLDRAISEAPQGDRRQVWVAKHRFLHEMGEYERAVDAAARAIALEDGWEIRQHRGDSRKQIGNYEGAARDYAAALVLVGEDGSPSLRAEILEARADTLETLSRWDEALHDARRAIDLDRARPLAHLVVARIGVKTGDAGMATLHFDRAVELVDSWTYRLERGVGHWMLGNPDRALEDIAAYARSGEADARWLALWAWEIERLRGEDQSAERWLGKTSDSDDPLLEKVVEVIEGELAADVVATAVADAGQKRDRLYVFYNLGVHAFVEGRYSDAAHWFERCIGVGLLGWTEHQLAQWHLEQVRART